MPSAAFSYPGQERRRHPRYRVPEDVFVSMKDRGETIGRVVDISRGGVSFRYIEDETSHPGKTSIDLFSHRIKALLEEVPVRTVSDFAVGTDIPYSSIPVRRRGLQFLKPDHRQKRRIEHFLKHHAGPAFP